MLSIILKPKILKGEPTLLSLLAAIVVVEAIKEFYPFETDIKWPNDILIKDKKAAGVLIEINTQGSRIMHVVVGMGINVFQNEEDLSGITSFGNFVTGDDNSWRRAVGPKSQTMMWAAMPSEIREILTVEPQLDCLQVVIQFRVRCRQVDDITPGRHGVVIAATRRDAADFFAVFDPQHLAIADDCQLDAADGDDGRR